MGGLRFKVDGKFQDSDEKNPTPPWAALRELQAAAKAYEESDDDELIRKEIRELFVPGSSLGGARPKANVLDDEQNLWIAKFPSKNDTSNAEGWEYVVHGLAKEAGLDLPEVRLESYVSQHNTLLVKRFDRIKEKRIHFTSAMTQLERRDGEEGASYLEMVDLIIQKGEPAKVDSDLEELWRRIVFSIAVSNTDDHLRNHGFLMNDLSGLKLSPAYDINPNPHGSVLSLNISETSNDLNFELAKSVAGQFRLSLKIATKIMDQVISAVSGWEDAAKSVGFSPRERNLMAPAFRLSD